jgi:hypothetical protein
VLVVGASNEGYFYPHVDYVYLSCAHSERELFVCLALMRTFKFYKIVVSQIKLKPCITCSSQQSEMGHPRGAML